MFEVKENNRRSVNVPNEIGNDRASESLKIKEEGRVAISIHSSNYKSRSEKS